MQPIRLLLVEDHLIVRAALRLWLAGYSHLQVVGETDSCQSALDLLTRERPDIVLLDIFLANASSLDYIPDLRSRSPQTRILMLTGATDEKLYARAMSEGAQGVVRKDESPEVLAQAIEHVHAGHLWFGSHFGLQSSPTSPANSSPEEQPLGWKLLTARESEIIELIGEGLKNRAIATRVGISEKTVQNHLTSIFRKLDVSDRLALAALAHRSDLLKPPST